MTEMQLEQGLERLKSRPEGQGLDETALRRLLEDCGSEVVLYLNAEQLEDRFLPIAVELAALSCLRYGAGRGRVRSFAYTEGQLSQQETYLTPDELEQSRQKLLRPLARYRRI